MAGELRVAGLQLKVDGAAEFQATLRGLSLQMTRHNAELAKVAAAYDKDSKATELLQAKKKNLTQRLDLQGKKTQELNRILAETEAKYGGTSTQAEKMRIEVLKSETAEAKLQKSLDEVNRELEEQEQAQADAAKEAEKAAQAAAKQAEAVSRAGREIDKHTDKLKKQRKTLADYSKNLLAFGDAWEKAGKKMQGAGKTMTTHMTLPIVGGFALAAKAAIDFEDHFAGVRKTVDASESEYEALAAGIRKASTQIPESADALSDLMATAGQLGVYKENLAGFTRVMADMGVATNLAGEEGATQMARFANIMGTNQAHFDRMGSVIVRLGNNSATTEADIMALAMRLAGAGRQIGLTEAQVFGFSAALSSVGIEAEAGGSAFSKIMVKMQLATETGKNGLKDFARVAGMSSKEFQAAFKDNAADALQAFIVGLSKMDEEGVSAIKTLDDMGLKEVRLRDTLMRATNASDLFQNSLDMANDEWRVNTALSREASERYGTTASKLTILKNKGIEAARTFGDKMQPSIDSLISTGDAWLQKINGLNAGQTELIMKGALVVAGIGPVVSVMGTLTRAVGGVATALGFLAAHPIVAVIAGVGMAGLGIAALVKHMNEVNDPVKKLGRAFDSVKLGLPADGANKFITGAQAELDRLELKKQVTLELEAEFGEDNEGIQGILTDGKAETPKQIKQIHDTVAGWVDPAIEQAKATIDEKVEGLRKYLQGIAVLSDDEKAAMIAAAAAGGQSVTEALESYGLGEADASELGKPIDDAIQAISSALDGLSGLTEADKQAIIAKVLQGGVALSTALSNYGLDETQAQTASNQITSAATVINAALDTLKDQLTGQDRQKVIDEIAAGGTSASEALKKYGVSTADAETFGKNIDTAVAAISSALDNAGVTLTADDKKTIIKTALDNGADFKFALMAYGIDDATATQIQTNLGGAVDSAVAAVNKLNGMPAVSEADQEKIADALQTKMQSLVTDIEQYKTDYLSIVDAVYKEGRKPTEEEIARMDELVKKIAGVRAELQTLGTEAGAYGEALSNTVKNGGGDQDMLGRAMVYEKDKKDSRKGEVAQEYQKKIAEAQQALELAKGTEGTAQSTIDALQADIDSLFAEQKAAMQLVEAEYTQSINELFEGAAASIPGAAEKLSQALKDYDIVAAFEEFENAEGDEGRINWAEKWKTKLGLDDTENLYLDLKTMFDGAIARLQEGMNSEELAPMWESFYGALTSGTIDTVDSEKVAGPLKALLALVDLSEEGKGIGANVGQGMVDGLETKQIDAENGIGKVSRSIIDRAKSLFGIASPSTVFKEIGGYVVEGLKVGLADDDGSISTASAALASSAVSGWAGIKGKAAPLGENFAAGIKKGIDDKKAELVAKATEIANAMLAAFRSVWGIASPSKVTAKYADYLVDGLQNQLGKRMSAMNMEELTGAASFKQSMRTINNNQQYSSNPQFVIENYHARGNNDARELMYEFAGIARATKAGMGAK